VFVTRRTTRCRWIYLKDTKQIKWENVLEVYKSEFRAFRIQPPVLRTCATAPRHREVPLLIPTPFRSRRSKEPLLFHRINFWYVLGISGGHFDRFYVCNKNFRDAVHATDSHSCSNLANSTRLIDLNVDV
jgi:hypothetical protein